MWTAPRSCVAREVAKRGALDALASSRPGTRSGGVDPELVMARDEAVRLGECAQGDGCQGHLVGGKRALGVTAGVPPRVGRHRGGSVGPRRRRRRGGLDDSSRHLRRVRARRAPVPPPGSTVRGVGRLDRSSTAGGTALHAITAFERQAILAPFERWGDIDGGYRKLAHRGWAYENAGLGVTVDAVSRSRSPGAGSVPARPQREQPAIGAARGGLDRMETPPDLDR